MIRRQNLVQFVRGNAMSLLIIIGSCILMMGRVALVCLWQVVKIVQLLLSCPDTSGDIGVIAPYSAQVQWTPTT
jgi:hypothetical protein